MIFKLIASGLYSKNKFIFALFNCCIFATIASLFVVYNHYNLEVIKSYYQAAARPPILA